MYQLRIFFEFLKNQFLPLLGEANPPRVRNAHLQRVSFANTCSLSVALFVFLTTSFHEQFFNFDEIR